MKVLHVGEYVKGGVATYLKEVLEFQDRSKDITFLSLLCSEQNSEKNMVSLKKGDVVYYPYKRNFLGILKGIKQINRYINEYNPDIIHIHSSFAGIMVRSIYFFNLKRVKIIYCSHGWSFLQSKKQIKLLLYKWIERILTWRTDLIINISHYENDLALKKGFPKKKSIVIENGVRDTIGKKRVEYEKEMNIDKNKINLLFVGRFDEQKGIDILLNVFKDHEAQLQHINLILIGGFVLDRDKEEITIPKQVTYLGWKKTNVIDFYFAQVDGVIIPSRWEGFGLVAIEAMKNRKAVIASNRGALPEIIDDKQTGIIFDISNAKELLSCLMNLDKKKLRNMGIKGREKYINNYTANQMNKKILECYKA